MSIIRPVDMQVMVQRAPEVNRNTNNDGSRAETQNSQFSAQFQKVVEQGQRQVNQTQHTEGQDVDPDGRGAKVERKPKPRPKTGTKKEDDAKKPQDIGQGMLDIRI